MNTVCRMLLYRSLALWLALFTITLSSEIAYCADGSAHLNVASSSPAKSSFQSISPQEATMLLKQRKEIVVLDVRTPEELREGKIENSTLVPIWSVFRNQLYLPKNTPIILVCAVGGRSYAAGRMLTQFGYEEVYNLSGGISAWKKAGLPLIY